MNLEKLVELNREIQKLDKSERLILARLIKEAPSKVVRKKLPPGVKQVTRKSKRGAFICPTCNEVFPTKRGIGLHKAKAHN